MELWQGAALVASATADAAGSAVLSVVRQPILRDATFKIVDEQGRLVLARGFDLVVGGDAYEFTRG